MERNDKVRKEVFNNFEYNGYVIKTIPTQNDSRPTVHIINPKGVVVYRLLGLPTQKAVINWIDTQKEQR
jgi:hypothetical protein